MKLNSLFNIAVSPLAMVALSIISFPGQAKAVIFSGSVSGKWGEPTSGSVNTNPVYTGVGTNTFTWGDPTPFKDASANQLMFEGSSFSADTKTLFKIGDLTYVNGTVLLGTSVESAPLNLSLSFNEATSVNQVFDYQFYFQNTPNLSDNPEDNADYVLVTEKNSKRSFTYGGEKYTLSLTGFSHDNGTTNIDEFRVLEGEKTTAAIFGQITKVPLSKKVPEPGLLMGLSAVGVYLISRRKVHSSNS